MGLFPRDERFFPMFSEIAHRITLCADLIAQIFAEPGRLDEIATKIKQLEHEADDITREINAAIDRSIVTPLDREDIHLLANRLDNVVDLLDGTARRVQMFHVSEIRPDALRLAEVLQRASRTIEDGVANIRKPKMSLERISSMKALEEEGDAIYGDAMRTLFSTGGDPLEVMKWMLLFDKLEDAIDECNHVSHVLESIAIKNG